MDRNLKIARIAAKQHSAFTTDQALAAGFTPDAIRHQLRTGRWLRSRRGIFVIAGSPDTWERAVSAAVLGYGPSARASFVTAGRLHVILDGSKRSDIHVTLPANQNRRSRDGIIVHRATLKGIDLTKASGIPVTGINRTIVDLARVLEQDPLEATIDDAVEAGKVAVSSLQRYRIGRGLEHSPGGAMLSEILRDRVKGIPQKKFERVFIGRMKTARPPEPTRQFRIGAYRVDFAYPGLMIAIELDGRAAHLRAAAFERDRQRHNELQLHGWMPLQFTWKQVTREWPTVEDTIERARLERGARGLRQASRQVRPRTRADP